MKNFLNYAKNRFLYNLIRILIIVGVGFLIGSCDVKASSYVPNDFSFIGKSGPGAVWVNPGNNSYGDIYTVVSDMSETTEFLNVVIATSTSMSSDTFKFGGANLQANYTYMLIPGRTAIVDGYELYVYLVQLSYDYGVERGCSSSGTNCYNTGVGWFYNTMSYNVVWSVLDVYNSDVLLDPSSSATYEKVDEILQDVGQVNDKLDQAEETRKGIWQTIKDLPNAFLDMLKSLFIPEDGYFEDWFNDLSSFFEEKLGFLATPFTIIIDFINRYLELDSSSDIVINIPEITVPNFEDHVIVEATTFNWSETLKSKEALNTLWQLYLAFVDVYLILNFINFCENKYNRIFGGDTTQYEYYTVEDSYTYDNNTGEVLSSRRNERTTTRKKVE